MDDNSENKIVVQLENHFQVSKQDQNLFIMTGRPHLFYRSSAYNWGYA